MKNRVDTAENNKLIAEFMDFKSTNKCIRSESGKYFDFHNKEGFSCIKEQEIQIESEWGWGLVEQNFLFLEDLKFHSDWNWLMQLVEKIESLQEYEVSITKPLNTRYHYCSINWIKPESKYMVATAGNMENKIGAV